MLVVEVDTRPSYVCLEVDFQVFLCVPVYHKTLPIANLSGFYTRGKFAETAEAVKIIRDLRAGTAGVPACPRREEPTTFN
jgi:hypothetical protein